MDETAAQGSDCLGSKEYDLMEVHQTVENIKMEVQETVNSSQTEIQKTVHDEREVQEIMNDSETELQETIIDSERNVQGTMNDSARDVLKKADNTDDIKRDLQNPVYEIDSEWVVQETVHDSNWNMQIIETNQEVNDPTVQKNNEPVNVILNSKGLGTSIMDIKSEFQVLTTKLQNKIASLSLRKDARAHFELELLRTYIIQSKTDLQNMARDVNKLLSKKPKSFGGASSRGLRGRKARINSAQSDEISDFEDAVIHKDNSDDNISPPSSGQNGLEKVTNRRRSGRKTSAVDRYKPELKLNSFGVKLGLNTSSAMQLTHSANDHMMVKHPNGKESTFQDSGIKFDDYESMFAHKLIQQEKAESLKQLNEEKARNRDQILLSDLQCNECGKILKTPRTLRRHKLLHSDQKPHICEVCGKVFTSREFALRCKHGKVAEESCDICGVIFHNHQHLRDHLKQIHNVDAVFYYPCVICDEIFSLKVDLHSHLGSHSDNPQMKCKVCDESFGDPFKLREHLLEHNKKFTCEMCGKKYFKAWSLEKHRKFHLHQVNCQVCGRVFRSQIKLDEHMNKHTGIKPFECDICHMKLFSASALENHRQRRHSDKNMGIKCVMCGKKFLTSASRNSHHLSAHTEEERRLHDVVVPMFKCDICGITVRAEYKRNHLNKHKSKSERKCNVCEICGASFMYISELKNHMFHIHNDESSRLAAVRADRKMTSKGLHKDESCTCDICGKQYASKSGLYTHKMKQHNDGNPHKHWCDICGKGFIGKSLLTLHYRIHTGEKPFTCQVCGSRFRSESNLSRHVSTVHNQERKYQCEFCYKGFSQKMSLLSHRNTHTGEKPYSCPICGRTFADHGSFYKHKRVHENKQISASLPTVAGLPSSQARPVNLAGQFQMPANQVHPVNLASPFQMPTDQTRPVNLASQFQMLADQTHPVNLVNQFQSGGIKYD